VILLSLLLACSTAPTDPGIEPAPPAPMPAPEAAPVRNDWGHPNDRDMVAFLHAYPALEGTRLDDCATCHCGGGPDCAEVAVEGQEVRPTNACDWCHTKDHHDDQPAYPRTHRQTLNHFGLAWHEAGRDAAAFVAIAGQDSDGDGATNAEELASEHFPGDARSLPGQDPAPLGIFTLPQLQALPQREQLLLSNAPSTTRDHYGRHRGVAMRDLLEAAGVDLTDPGITGVTLVAPDGYRKEVAWERVINAAPASRVHGGLDVATLGEDCGWVDYPPGVRDGDSIPESWAMVAWAVDGQELEPVALDVATSKLSGDGPLRAMVPQAVPGRPDRVRGDGPSGCDDGYDFDPDLDHNAGWNVRGLVALRVDPLPEGLEDLDWSRGGWSWIRRGELVVYGRGVTAD
jgi:hypothetical protein